MVSDRLSGWVGQPGTQTIGRPAFDRQPERIKLTAVGLVPPLDEVVGALLRAALEVDKRPVHGNLGQAGQGAECDLLDARLGRRRQGNGVTVAAQSAVHPEDVDHGLRSGVRLLGFCRLWVSGHAEATSSLLEQLDTGCAGVSDSSPQPAALAAGRWRGSLARGQLARGQLARARLPA